MLAAWRFAPRALRGEWARLGLMGLMLGNGLGAQSPPRWSALLWLTLGLGCALNAQERLCRAALSRSGDGWTRSPKRGSEWRLSAVWALTATFVSMLLLLGLVALMALAYGVASAGRGFSVDSPSTWAGAVGMRGRLVVDAAAALVAIGVAWAWARISLAPAATVAEGRILVLATWASTRGFGLAILAATLIVAAPSVALLWALEVLARSAEPLVAWIAHMAQAAVIASLWLPPMVGLMAYFYPRLSEQPAVTASPR